MREFYRGVADDPVLRPMYPEEDLGAAAETLDGIADQVAAPGDADRLLALDQALQRLAAVDANLVNLVELRFFAGLELAEIAALCGRAERSLKRDWRKARALLHASLEGGLADE